MTDSTSRSPIGPPEVVRLVRLIDVGGSLPGRKRVAIPFEEIQCRRMTARRSAPRYYQGEPSRLGLEIPDGVAVDATRLPRPRTWRRLPRLHRAEVATSSLPRPNSGDRAKWP